MNPTRAKHGKAFILLIGLLLGPWCANTTADMQGVFPEGEAASQPAGADIHKILETSAGRVYIGTDKGLSLWIGPGQYRNYTVFDGLVANLVYDLAEDSEGRIWIATAGGISILSDTGFSNIPCDPKFINDGIVRITHQSGEMMAHTASGDELTFRGGRISLVKVPREKISEDKYGPAIKFDPLKVDFDSKKWRKVLGQGVAALYPRNYKSYRTTVSTGIEGKRTDTYGGLYAMLPVRGQTGAFWFVTQEGELKRFDAKGTGIEPANIAGLDKGTQVTGLGRDAKGFLWIMAEDNLYRVNDNVGQKSDPRKFSHAGVGAVRKMVEDGETLWFLADNGLLHLRDGELTTYTHQDGLPPGVIMSVQRDKDNNLWAGGPGGFGRIVIGGKKKSLAALEDEVVRFEQMIADMDGAYTERKYREIAASLENSRNLDAKGLLLLARIRLHLVNENCPSIGWQLATDFKLITDGNLKSDTYSIAGKGCDITARPISAKKKEEKAPDQQSAQPSNLSRTNLKDFEPDSADFISGPFADVLKPIVKALSLEPGNKTALLERANILIMSREWRHVQKALNDLKQSEFSHHPNFKNNIAVAHAMLGQVERANRIFEQITKDTPDYLPSLFNRFRLLMFANAGEKRIVSIARDYVEAENIDGPWVEATRDYLSLYRFKRGLDRIVRPLYIFIFLIVGGGGYFIYRSRFKQIREKRKQERSMPFITVKNPYIVGNPIRSEKMFYGREDDFRFIRRKLKGEDKSLVIVFCGERRSGKTSILFQILNGRLGKGFIPVLLDMQSIPVVNSEADFLEKMAEETLDAVGHKEWLDRFQWKGDQVNAFKTYENLLVRINDHFPDDRIVYLFDEYELIEEKMREGHLSKNLIYFFSNLLESHRHSFIFTGSKRIEERSEDFWKILIGKSVYRNISFLSKSDTLRLITEPVDGKMIYGTGVVEQIFQYSAGSPFYTQVICQNLVDYANINRRNYIDKRDLEAVILELLDNPLPQMIYFWDNLPENQKQAISLIATTLERGNKYINPKALFRFLDKEKITFPIKINELQSNLEQLFYNNILAKDNMGRYQFKIDLFRRWIARDHSIWEVIRQ